MITNSQLSFFSDKNHSKQIIHPHLMYYWYQVILAKKKRYFHIPTSWLKIKKKMINLLVFKIFAITGVHKIKKMKNKPS